MWLRRNFAFGSFSRSLRSVRLALGPLATVFRGALKRPARTVAWLVALLWAGGPLSGALAAEARVILQTSPLAGFQYHAGRALFPLMQVGDALTLVREPDNPYDPRAVRVEWRGAMIGYAPRADNIDLARLMDHGAHLVGRIVHLQKARDPWKRVLFEVLVVE